MKLRKVAWILWTLLTLTSLGGAIDRQVAAYRADAPQYMISKWDEANQRVLSFRSQTPKGPAEIQINGTDGSQAVTIDVTRDFPGAIAAVVSDVAAGPDRSLVAVCRIVYETPKLKPPKLKELILTYSSSGALTKIWDIAPYEGEAVSVDEDGNVYSFGVRFGAGNAADYGTIVEYSPDGKVVKEMLPMSLFPVDADPTRYDAKTGPCFLRASEGKIYVYAATLNEVFVLDRSGNISKRHTIGDFVRDIAASNHYASHEIGRGYFDSEGNLYFDMLLRDPVFKKLPDYMYVGARLNAASVGSSQWQVLKSTRPLLDPRLIGVTADGSLVSLVRTDRGATVEITSR